MTAPSHACPACATRLPEAAVFCPRCGAATPASDRAASASAGDEERLRTALAERYRVEREIGRGGNAVVYLAHDLRHKRPVAIKVLMPELALSVRASRFLREIEIAAKLNHPHILPLLDSGETDGFLYYVMPYVEGESLRERLRRERQLSIADALQLAREVADALDYAHGRDVVHRDIKPENILLQASHAVVADFGIARALSEAGGRSVTATGIAVGTPLYMSPEQGAGSRTLDGRSDVYSLGCVVYEMLAGRPPFTGETPQEILARHSLDPVPSLRAARPGVPEAVERVVNRALAKSPADRWATGSEFAAALASGLVPVPPGAGRPRGVRIALATAGVVAIVAIGLLVARGRPPAALDQNLVAVAPFDVLAPGLGLWREGLVDVLSRNLDGAGPLRTVAPTVVVRRWSGRADAPSAAQLGRQTGARLAVFGQVLGVGGDSVRLNATLYDVATGRPLDEFQVSGAGDRMDRLADSLTMALLRELGRTRPIGAVRRASLGSTSLPAMKAFLQGEQFYRRTDFDSAIAYYERAIAQDSGFALAYHRIGLAYGWQGPLGDSAARAYALKAGAFNRGLAPRESLLITGDSLGALLVGDYDSAWWPHARRLFATLTEATRRYPDDPEVWYALGDARYHFGFAPGIDATRQQALDAFDRSIALDSAFGPSYIHPVDLGLNLAGPAVARRYVRAYLALDPKDLNALGIRLVERLLDTATAHSPETQQYLDTVDMAVLGRAFSGLGRWPDSAETGLRVLRAYVLRHPSPQAQPRYEEVRVHLATALAYRGHLRESAQLGTAPWLMVDYALFGTMSTDSLERVIPEWARARRYGWLAASLRWWAGRGDTAALRAMARGVDSASRAAHPPLPRGVLQYTALATQAYLALARHDTTDALRRFLALPDTLCSPCFTAQITRVDLLAARGRDAEAAPLLDRELAEWSYPRYVTWILQRGRVNERLGNRAKAIASYRFVADVWMHADPELQPFVAEAKAALGRLVREPRP